MQQQAQMVEAPVEAKKLTKNQKKKLMYKKQAKEE